MVGIEGLVGALGGEQTGKAGMDMTGMASGALNVGILIAVCAAIIGVMVFFFWVIGNWKKYQDYTVEIHDPVNDRITFDRAGIFREKTTGDVKLFLKKAKVGLDPDPVPKLAKYVKGNIFSPKKKIYLRQDGYKSYCYIDFTITKNTLGINVGEENVNWATHHFNRYVNMYKHQTALDKMMPILIIIIPSVIILIIFIYFFKTFPELTNMMVQAKEGLMVIRDIKSGTTVLP